MRHQLWIVFALLLWAGGLAAGPKEDAAKRRQEAEKLFTQGEYSQALTAYDEAHALFADPSDWLGRAQVLIKLRRFQEANEAYQQFLALGKAGKKQREIERAMEDLSIILQTKLSCTSSPSGATVYLNSRVDDPLGKTPLENNLPPGTHRVIFEKEGFEPLIQTVTIEPRASQTINAELTPALALLTIQASPAAAEIKLNGELRGKTPLELKLPDGAYELEASAPGYPGQRKRLEVKAQQRYTWSIDLTQPPPGTLLIQVSPSSAVVTLDGAAFPQGAKIALTPGIYPLVISADGYQTKQQEVSIESDRESPLETSLEAKGALLQVKANRREYTLLVNHKPVQLDATGAILLPSGEQLLSLTSPKASTWSQRVSLSQRSLAEVNFKNLPQPATKLLLAAGAASLATSGLFTYAWLARAIPIHQLCDPQQATFDPDVCNTDNERLVALNRQGRAFFGVAVGAGIIGAAVLGYGSYRRRLEGKTSVRLKEQGAPP